MNEKLGTTAPGVWAVGDCAGTPQFTHAAYDDFRVVRDNLLGNGTPRTTRNRLIPSCLFTDPELVRVGLNEKQARQLSIPYRVGQMTASAVLRTRTVSEPRGFIKMLIAADSDRILGFTAFCVEASELLAAVQTAMAGNLPYTVLRDTLYTHPTMSEGFVFFLSDSRLDSSRYRALIRSGPISNGQAFFHSIIELYQEGTRSTFRSPIACS